VSSSLEPLPRRRRRSLVNGITLAVVVAVAGAAGMVVAVDQRITGVREVTAVGEVLSPGSGRVENYLLVGSDSREGIDPDDPTIGVIGTTNDVSGQRADTIMILRRDRNDGSLAVLSLPRDLWVDIPGRRADRINAAYGRGADVLVRTVQESLGVPVHHYLEVDLAGFQGVVAALGGVELCVDTPVRDVRSGLALPVAGCHLLDPAQALAYVRSRTFETFTDGRWRKDPTADIGRTERQRAFIVNLAAAVRTSALANPFTAGSVLEAVVASVGAEPGFDAFSAAARLRGAASGAIDSYSLPVRGANIDGKSVLQLASGAQTLLDWFAGIGERPQPT
jgi:LCP family protein required for cell wall assembly